MARRGILLINVGTPAAPRAAEVRLYLHEFLSDPRVLDIPAWKRALLLQFAILPRRSIESAKAYQKIWTDRGSPLLVHGLDLARSVQELAGPEARVELAMRYQTPSIEQALSSFRAHSIDAITVFPLYPQYSSAAWGSAVEKLFAEAAKRWNVPALCVVPPFYEHPSFIRAFASVARAPLEKAHPDRVLFSFHGLPARHIAKSDESRDGHCLISASCCDALGEANRNCYRAQCFATARALAHALAVPREQYQVTFQSRLAGDPWIEPFTDFRVRELAASGVRRLAVFCPSFTADCLETLEEIGMRAREEFRAHGGEELTLIPSLNSAECWARAILEIAAITPAGPR